MARLLPASACAAALLLLAGGCHSGPADERPALTFVAAETAERPAAYWQEAVNRVAADADVRIELTVLPLGEDPTAYAGRMLTESGAVPDVMAGVSPQGLGTPELLYAWQPDEVARFRRPYAGSVKGQIYRLPTTGEAAPLVYYNADLFARAGIDGPPGTYAELLDDAAALKDAGVRPFAIGGVDAATTVWSAAIATDVDRPSPGWMQHRRLGHVHFCDEGFRASAEKVAQLGAYVSLTDAGGDDVFLAGEAAMYPVSSRFALTAAARPPGFAVGAFAWPTDDGGTAVPALLGGLSVSAAAKDLPAARRFATAFSLDAANLDHAATAEGLFPAVTGYEPPEGTGELYRAGYAVFRAAAEAGALVSAPGVEDGDDGIPSAVAADWQTAAARLLDGQTNADEACAALDAAYAPTG